MLRRRRKTDGNSNSHPEMVLIDSGNFVEKSRQSDLLSNNLTQGAGSDSLRDYFKFALYSMLLLVPLYAITKSILKQDWVMVIIDALIVPVGFVHGLLILFGFID